MEIKLKTIAIIQARMGSTRLPGKVLAELCGMPMLAVLIARVRCTKGIDEIVVATTINKDDDVLVEWLSNQKIATYRGSENDVLDRFWRCASKHAADVIIRITADDPLKDADVIGIALKEFQSIKSIDYVSNTIKPTFPEGLDIEIFSFAALERAAKEATLPSEREHVTPYIWKNPDRFSIRCFEMQPNLSGWRWTVDKPEDLLFIQTVLSHFNNDITVGYKTIIQLLLDNPKLININAGTIRNEGYLKTISKEKSL